MTACALLKMGRRSNVSSLLEEEALTIPGAFGTDVYELSSYAVRMKFPHFAQTPWVRVQPASFQHSILQR
jgi:hypothetical protein